MSKREPRPGLKFLMEHVAYQNDKCLVWPYSCCTAGYGSFMAFRKLQLAHRFMCLTVHGEPPSPQHHAAHSCGNRRCINPRHLSWKSPSENQLDRKRHGTHKKTAVKLTAQQVEQIRRLRSVETSIETAAKYGVTESNIRLIQDGKIWKANRKNRVPFTADEINKIRNSTGTLEAIAERFQTTQSSVWRIQHGRSYRSVPF